MYDLYDLEEEESPPSNEPFEIIYSSPPVIMRQLLSRKSRTRLASEEQERRSATPSTNSSRDHAAERVFPIRNVRTNGDMLALFPNVKTNGSARADSERNDYVPSLPTIRSNEGSPAPTNRSFGTRDSDEQRKVSDRSQFIPTASGPPRVILNSSYKRCEDEPIHTPGAIQSFGALIGLKYNENGALEVRIASENTRKIIGYGPEQLFELPSFLDVLKDDARDELIARIENALGDSNALQDETRLDIFQLTLTYPYEPDVHLWCAVHLAPNPSGLVICEFEEYTDALYLKDAEAAMMLPVKPVHLLGSKAEDLEKSCVRMSKPIPALKVARQKMNQEFSSLDLFNAMTQAQKQITECDTVQKVFEVTVGLISEVSGFHRVMLYQFDSHMNGRVDAEMLNPMASTDVYRGLHFPASDIPKQARELYKINRIRILHDRDALTSRLVCRNETEFATPLDLTHSYLRAMSPIHNKYLANIGVRSTMSISLVINGDLWGLIACHGYGDVGTRVSLPIRELCRNVGECSAQHIHRLLQKQRIDARRLIATNPSINGSGNANLSDLLKLVNADFALISIDDKPRAIGRLEPYQEALAIAFYLQSCKIRTIRSSHSVKADFPGLSYPPGLKTIAGLLYVPLSIGEGNSFLLFFRKSRDRQMCWAGNPNDKKFRINSEYLEPRSSFQRWNETIVGTSEEWTDDQLDTASVLALLYGKTIEAWKQKDKGQNGTETEESVTHSGEETFSLNATATRVMKGLQKEADRKGLELSVSIHDQLPAVVKGDSDRFKHVLKYFTENGFKQSSVVSVEINLVRSKDGVAIIGVSVEDHGPGMSEAQLDDTFQEFEEAQEDGWPLTSEESSGGNAELATIARYIRKINGQILVSSELSKGTVFSVELPFEHASDLPKQRKLRNLFLPTPAPLKSLPLPNHQPPTPTSSIRPRTTEDSPSGARRSAMKADGSPPHTNGGSARINSHSGRGRPYEQALSQYGDREGSASHSGSSGSHGRASPSPLNILVAEDDAISLRMLDEKLSAMGHQVDIASNGHECHSQFASNQGKVDVILMDLEMPGVDGTLSTKMIRFLEKQSGSVSQKNRVPIIALSSAFDDDNRFDYIENGFDGWILKPIDYRRLHLMLDGVKKSKLRRDSLYVPGEKGGWFLP